MVWDAGGLVAAHGLLVALQRDNDGQHVLEHVGMLLDDSLDVTKRAHTNGKYRAALTPGAKFKQESTGNKLNWQQFFAASPDNIVVSVLVGGDAMRRI
jgi:hypothetical protein